jgi:hypothetical protein
MVIKFISLLLTMATLQINNLNLFQTVEQEMNFSIVQNCYFERNDGCLGTF